MTNETPALPSVTLKQMHYFTEILRCSSLSAAAEVLHVAQPALTRQMQLLEGHFGTRLLDRSKSGVRATPAGERFRLQASVILHQTRLAVSAPQDTSTPSGLVTISLPIMIAALLMPRLIRLASERFPDVELRFIDERNQYDTDAISNNLCDFAIVPNADQLSGVSRHTFIREKLFVVGAPSLIRRYAPVISLADAVSLPLVMHSRHYQIRRKLEEAANQLGLTLNIAFEQTSTVSILGLIRAGLAASFANRPMIVATMQGGDIDLLEVEQPSLERAITLVIPDERPLSPAAGVIKDMTLEIAREIHEEGDWDGEWIESWSP